MTRRKFVLYLVIIIPLLAGIIFLLWQGKTLHPSSYFAEIKNANAGGGSIAESLKHPLAILLLQILVVLCTAKVMGHLFRRIGFQPVIGEIAAGIILGPSLLGWLSPDLFTFLFPASSLDNLHLVSQVGLVLFMFIIGMELNMDILKNRASEAIIISHVSIFFPYLLGIILAWFLYSSFAPSNVSFIVYALFIGIAMSITAFPVLARILKDRQITQTHIGGMAIICAAIDDITAWCLLAIVISITKAGNITSAMFTIVITVVYVLVMFFVVRPVLRKLSERYYIDGKLVPRFTAIIFVMLFLSAFIGEVIGIHALFGAFLAGVIMPTNFSLRQLMTDRIEDVSMLLLLPLFFAFTGLRTQIGLLNSCYLWMVCGLIIFLAVFGKFVGSTVASKLTGQSWKDAISIGALMNTRGLMELIVLNIGYDLGILTPEIFTMMVFMALVTTAMTSPALNLIDKIYTKK